MIFMQWPAVKRNSMVVGHVHFNLARTLSAFLRRPTELFAEVTGSKVNRGAGYGSEIPCKYHFLLQWTT